MPWWVMVIIAVYAVALVMGLGIAMASKRADHRADQALDFHLWEEEVSP